MKILVTTLLLAVLSLTAFATDQPQAAYKLGPEDIISVTVAHHPEFSGDFLIPTDGEVNLPAVGQTKVAGRTIQDLCAYVTEQLRDRLKNPEVVVSLKVARMQRVYVLGAVSKPGPYDMKPGWRVTEAVAAAGGLATGIEPTDCKATILRSATGARQSVEFSSAVTGAMDANLSIESGDVLTVESEETMPVYVVGKVKTPGLYKLRKSNPGVMEALTLAGGTLDDAALSRVTITHVSGDSEPVNLVPAVLDGKQDANAKLQSGDLVTVPETTSRVAVLGYVRTPGYYPLKDGHKLMLADALSLAGGPENRRGGISSIVVIRPRDGKQEKLSFNLKKFLKSGDMTQNPEILAGDVVYIPETNKPDWDIIFRALSTAGVLMNPLLN